MNTIKLNPQQPFALNSGWKSQIYCDNHLTLSFLDVRTFIKNNLALCIQQNYDEVDSIAGVATAGIPHGVLVAEVLNKPFIYVRSEAKKHGLTNRVEGELNTGGKVMMVLYPGKISCSVYKLRDYVTLIQYVQSEKLIAPERKPVLSEWRKNSGVWM